MIRRQILAALRGGQAYDTLEEILKEVPEPKRFARPSEGGHSAWEIVEHMRLSLADLAAYTKDADGSYVEKKWPDEYWPKSQPAPSEDRWQESVKSCLEARREVERLAMDESRGLCDPLHLNDSHTLLRELLLAIDHSAYHLGEIVELTFILQGQG